MDEFDDDLEAIFIEETFHKSEPIREKPVQTVVEKVKLRRKRISDKNGIKIEGSNKRLRLNDRFQHLQQVSHQMGVVFEGDEEDDEDEQQYEDIDIESKLNSNSMINRPQNRKILLSLANKLKKRSIANRLGMAYVPAKTRLREARTRLNTTKSWSEKFGKLLAAKKLLYLPLLYRKYRAGPRKSRQELDIEIDLYMAEVKRTKKLKLALGDITNGHNNNDDSVSDANNNLNNGIKVLDHKKMFGGFGGPGWRKRLQLKQNEDDLKQSLDMDIENYMQNKDKNVISIKTECEEKDELDMDLDRYMAQIKKTNVNKNQVVTNVFD